MSVQTSSYKKTSLPQSAYCRWCERYIMYASDNVWNEFLLVYNNVFLKYMNRRRQCMHQLWEPRTDGEHFKLCKILTEFPGKFREYWMNITANPKYINNQHIHLNIYDVLYSKVLTNIFLQVLRPSSGWHYHDKNTNILIWLTVSPGPHNNENYNFC
jgi:hypothetical protein